MKIYICHPKELNYEEELYKPIRDSNLNTKYEFIFPHEVYQDAKDFVSKDIIRTCDLVIAEVSHRATGLGIELGRADAFHRPIICLHHSDCKVSGSLRNICDNFIQYDTSEELVDVITKILQDK